MSVNCYVATPELFIYRPFVMNMVVHNCFLGLLFNGNMYIVVGWWKIIRNTYNESNLRLTRSYKVISDNGLESIPIPTVQ